MKVYVIKYSIKVDFYAHFTEGRALNANTWY